MAPKRVIRPLALGALLIAGGILFALSPPVGFRAATASLISAIEAAPYANVAQVGENVPLRDSKNKDEYLASLKAHDMGTTTTEDTATTAIMQPPEEEEIEDPLMLNVPENMRHMFYSSDDGVFVPASAPSQDRYHQPPTPTYVKI
ncbi:hypothetical protein SEPCBS57363_001075 [Sporothrix epigloea]|uniref:Transmembrane protein n=1 Tax=Sporothrix epigloea TaxID=1892477 RepID=A0ABP0D8A4_9PEZI